MTAESDSPMALRARECPECGKWHFAISDGSNDSATEKHIRYAIRPYIDVREKPDLLKIKKLHQQFPKLLGFDGHSLSEIRDNVINDRIMLAEMSILNFEWYNDACCELDLRLGIEVNSNE